jgi:hypothetical protein
MSFMHSDQFHDTVDKAIFISSAMGCHVIRPNINMLNDTGRAQFYIIQVEPVEGSTVMVNKIVCLLKLKK